VRRFAASSANALIITLGLLIRFLAPAINPKTPIAVAAFFRQLPQGTSERQPAPESRSFEKFPAARFSGNRSDGRNKSPTGPQDSTIGAQNAVF
jgi:hypothetical protein